MTTKDAIHQDLAAVAELIAVARSALSQDQLVDIGEIPEKIRAVMGSITDLPPDDAVELRPLLIALLTDFKSFSTEVTAKISDIEASGGSASRAAAGGSGA